MQRNHPRNNHGLTMMLAAACMLASSTVWAQNTVPATQPTVPAAISRGARARARRARRFR